MKIIDLHEDFGIGSSTENVFTKTAQNNIKRLSTQEDTLIFASTFPFRRTWANNGISGEFSYEKASYAWVPEISALYSQAGFYSYLSRSGTVKIIKSKHEVDTKGSKFLMSIEGCDPIPDYSYAYELYDLGYRCLGLTWNHDNKYGASCFSKKDYGLTGSGRDLVDIANRLGMIVDLAHASPLTIKETAEVSSEPIIVSHTNVASLKDHKRNLSDEVISSVADSKGIIGISGIADMIGDSPTIQSMSDHINYIGNNFGWDHVALGSDFLGMTALTAGFTEFDHFKDLWALIEKPELVFHDNAQRILHKVVKS